MSCATYNYKGCSSVTIGYDFSSKITYKPSGSLFDFTDYTVTMEIEDSSGNSILSLAEVGDETTTGIYIPDPDSGEIFIQIRQAESGAISANSNLYYINLLSSGGDLTPMLSGQISFTAVV